MGKEMIMSFCLCPERGAVSDTIPREGTDREGVWNCGGERRGKCVYECSGWLHAQLFEAFPWRSGPVEVQVLALGAQEPRYHLFFFFFMFVAQECYWNGF